LKERRKCPECGKLFKAMTDAQWKVALEVHLAASDKHRKLTDKRT